MQKGQNWKSLISSRRESNAKMDRVGAFKPSAMSKFEKRFVASRGTVLAGKRVADRQDKQPPMLVGLPRWPAVPQAAAKKRRLDKPAQI